MNITTVKLLTGKQNLWNRRKMVYLKKLEIFIWTETK